MAHQREPHEQEVLLSAVQRTFVGYFGVQGQIGTGIPIHEKPAAPPARTVYEQEYVLYQDIQLEDGTILRQQHLQSEKEEPRKFFRGRVVTDPKEAVALLTPPFVRELISGLQRRVGAVKATIDGPVPTVVVIMMTDGTGVCALLRDGDVPPPDGASPYPVGESPEEVSEAELAAIRQDVKDGVYDDEEAEAAAAEEAYRSGWETTRAEGS